MNETDAFILLIFPVFFLTLWCFILWILSFGWRKLAAYYHHPLQIQGEVLRFQSARINSVNYNGVINLGLQERGLYLVPMVLFRPFHKPLFIPWEEIIAQPFKRALYQGYFLQFRSIPGVRFELPHYTFDKIVDFLQKRTGYKMDNQIDRVEFRR
jgi:hypothetical protein